jgi:lipopolysaccharide export system permease protein
MMSFLKKIPNIRQKVGWKIIDTYILKKFLSSFVFAITLLMTIIVVFDFSENVHRFLDNNISMYDIFTKYYLNFIPYFINLFIPLFTFISVIWFTSRMSNQNEIIAILSGGINYYRFLVPFLVGAVIISSSAVLMSNELVPKTTEKMNQFKENMMKRRSFPKSSIHVRNSESSYIYVERWDKSKNIGYHFTYEVMGNQFIKNKISAKTITYNPVSKRWTLKHYSRRTIHAGVEKVSIGEVMDTVFNIVPNDLAQDTKVSETMSYLELNRYIKAEEIKGTGMAKYYIIEKQTRLANSLGTFIMTILGFCVASQKTRRGVGVHLFFGIGLAFTFVFFQQISNVFSMSGSIPPGLGPWIPNFIFLIICGIMLKYSTK